MRAQPKDDQALKDEQITKLQQKVGELVLDVDILREACDGPPHGPDDVRRVSGRCRTSPSVGSVSR